MNLISRGADQTEPWSANDLYSTLATTAVAGVLTIQVVGSHQQLEAELGRNFHIGHILCVLHLFIVVEVFTNFFQDEAIDVIKDAGVGFGFHEAI